MEDLSNRIIELMKLSLSGVDPEFLAKGEILIEQGAEDKDIFLIIDGKVLVLINDIPVAVLDSPAIVGEMSLIYERRSATVKVVDEITFHRLKPNLLTADVKNLLKELANLRNKSNTEKGYKK
ncbi:MAG: cyclic nucleotide-binding domain-containing protein [Candidatus Gracilibacteria bacterium]|nr:cyclic nucleotide-binding domain-containing protein [Candidatus Gracilibacteria bacterium]MDD2908539.1 cyclic nucleotide-binding domain-containing protein [Candidatus Gracilibacteria bacterium]